MYRNLSIIIAFGLIAFSFNLYSQCPTVDFDVPSSLCIDQNFVLNNNTTDAISYEWDFCEGELSTVPTSANLFKVTGSSFARGIEFVKESGNWYAFVTSRNTSTLFRLDFGNSLDNPSPVINNLGNISGLLDEPEPIHIIKEGNNWYALTHNGGGASLCLISFGTDITNASPTAEIVLTSVGDLNAGMEVDNDDGNWIVIVTKSSRAYQRINFGSSITNSVSSADLMDDGILTGTPGDGAMRDFQLVKSCDQWYGFGISFGSDNFYLLEYGTDLFSTPTLTVLGDNTIFGTDDPYRVEVGLDGANYFAFVTTVTGNFYRVDLGNDLNNPTFTSSNLLDIGAINFSLDLVQDGSLWRAFSINSSGADFYKVTFTDNCSAVPSSSTEEIPESISYTSSGNYEIGLKAFDSDGNISFLTKTVTVSTNVAPDIDFSTSFPISCASNPIDFTAVSSADDIQFYDWDFGDGNTSTDENPTHTYASPGTYDVQLTVTDADPCENFTIGSITIYEDPVSSFDVPVGVVCNNQPITFTNTTADNFEGNETFEWQVDGVIVSTSRNLDYEFDTGGTFEIKLITSIPGCSDEVAQNFNVTEGPSPNFTVSDACVSTLFDFTNTTTGDNIVSYEWDFDNGFMSSEENPDPFEYDSPGTYNVTLTTQNAAGCMTSIEKSLTVYDPPVVDFSNDLSCELDPTQFTDLSTVNNANIDTWQWDFGDPASGANTSTDQNPQHIFSQAGDFTVRLITTTTFGCIDSLTQVVSVNQAPSANFNFDKVCIGEEIQFQDQSEAVPGEQITSYAWNLGGQFSAEQNPTATFDFAIDYNVSLTVTSQNLCSNTFQESITVLPPKNVGFKVEDACENVLVHLYDTTQQTGDPIASRVWQFADQGSAMDSSVFNDFMIAGDYDVSLAVTTERGCEYEGSQSVTINEAPEASFEASDVFGAPPLEVDFMNNSNQALSHAWDFGDGNLSNETNPSNTFQEEGTYDVSLAIEDANGCRDTTNLIINALVPELELELQQVTIVDKSIVLTIRNNGTLSIDSMKASINLGDRVVVEEDIVRALPASNNPSAINHTLDLNLASRNIDYVCVTLTPILNNADDSNSINNTKCKNFEASIIFIKPYPNPAINDLNITIMSETEGAGNIRIISSIGEVVLNENFDGVRGKNVIQLDVSSIKGGVYLVEVEMAGSTSNSRIAIDN